MTISKLRLITLSLIGLFLTACHSVSYVHQEQNAAFIQFSGNYYNTQVELAELTFNIDKDTPSFELNNQQVVKFQVPTGKHQLLVSRDGKAVIRRAIFLSHGQTLEVTIP